VYFEPYCGRWTNITDAGLGQGPNVVLDLVQKVGLQPGTEVFFDNLFTSFPLLDKLSQMGVAGTGTVRQNRLQKVPIPSKKDMLKKTVERGYQETLFKGDQVLASWKDNQPVYVASNKYTAERATTVGRFCRTSRQRLQVIQKNML
jgi:hypothetical protein